MTTPRRSRKRLPSELAVDFPISRLSTTFPHQHRLFGQVTHALRELSYPPTRCSTSNNTLQHPRRRLSPSPLPSVLKIDRHDGRIHRQREALRPTPPASTRAVRRHSQRRVHRRTWYEELPHWCSSRQQPPSSQPRHSRGIRKVLIRTRRQNGVHTR